jgi:hypothetical protein
MYVYLQMQAVLLLLQILTLDTNVPLRQIASGADPSDLNYPFVKPDIVSKISECMRDIAMSQGAFISPLVLTWASVLIVFCQDAATGATLAGSIRSKEPLKEYKDIIDLRGGQERVSQELNGLIMYHSLSLLLTSFGLDPETIPSSRTDLAVEIMEKLFEINSVNEMFILNHEDAITQPILRFIKSCSMLFPGKPLPLLRIFASICSTYDGSFFICSYFNAMDTLTLELLGDQNDDVLIRDNKEVEALQNVAVIGVSSLSIERGTKGRLITASSESKTLIDDGNENGYVCWNVKIGLENTILLLMHRLSVGLACLTQTNKYNTDENLMEIEGILRFFECLCSFNDLIVIDLLNEGISQNKDTSSVDADFITIVSKCSSSMMLAGNSSERGQYYAISSLCFKIFSYFAPYSPDRVFSALLGALGISSLRIKLSKGYHHNQEMPAFSKLLSAWRGKIGGSYEAVSSLFHLVSVFLKLSYGPRSDVISFSISMTQMTVPYIISQVGGDEKWNLSASCLSVVRHSLWMESSIDENDLFEIKKEILKLIYPLLPPDANKILQDVNHQLEAESIEKCCVMWLRLVPVLLTTNGAQIGTRAGNGLEAGRRFNEEYFFTSVDGVSSSPAATLLSYLSYPYFIPKDKSAVVRCMAHLLSYDSKVPITAFLPKNGPRLSLFESCMVISNALNVENPTHIDSLFGAACDVLCTAVSHHPTLAVLLLPDISNEKGQESKVHEKILCSCTQHIISFAENSVKLYNTYPRRLEKVLDVICASITSKTSGNGIATSFLYNESIWEAFMEVLKLSSSREISSAFGMHDADQDSILHQLNVEMKIMDIIVATVCSAPKNDSEGFGWGSVDKALNSKFPLFVGQAVQRYCVSLREMDSPSEVHKAREWASLASIELLRFALDNPGLRASLEYEENSLIFKLWKALSNFKALSSSQEYRNLCQTLYSKILKESDNSSLIYSEPFNTMANLLLQPITENGFEPHESPEPEMSRLPTRIGSAWGRVVKELSHLGVQITYVNNCFSLRQSLSECIRSLDSLVAVCLDRYPRLEIQGLELNFLIEVLSYPEYGARESVIVSNVNNVMPMKVSASRMLVMFSQALQTAAFSVDTRSFFELITVFDSSETPESMPEDIIILSNVLKAGINIVDILPERLDDIGGICDSVMPRLFALSCHPSPSVSCPAASLVIKMMRNHSEYQMKEDFTDKQSLVETLDAIFDQPQSNDHTTEIFRDQALRIKSILLVLSEMIRGSTYNADLLISKGLCDTLVSTCHWVARALPDEGCIDDNSSQRNARNIVDLSGMYTIKGHRFEVHNIWCILLSLCSLLWSALPGHRKVQTLLLRVAILMGDRLLQALLPPIGSNQIISVAFLEEGKSVSRFICLLSKNQGEWLVNQPKMMSKMRQATANFLHFFAGGGTQIEAAAISPEEISKISARDHNENISSIKIKELKSLDADLSCSSIEEDVGLTQLSLVMDFDLHSMVKYALDYQLLSAPEISEAESLSLRNSWVPGAVLDDLVTTTAANLVTILEEQDTFSRLLPKSLDLQSILNRYMEVIRSAQALMGVISYNMDNRTLEEVQGICQRASAMCMAE